MPPCNGLAPSDLLNLAPALAALLQKIMRQQGMALTEVANEVGQTPEITAACLRELVAKGYLSQAPEQAGGVYKIRFKTKTARVSKSAIWTALEDSNKAEENKL